MTASQGPSVARLGVPSLGSGGHPRSHFLLIAFLVLVFHKHHGTRAIANSTDPRQMHPFEKIRAIRASDCILQSRDPKRGREGLSKDF